MFNFVNDEIFEPTELEKCIKTFTTNICAEIVEKQNELMLTTIQRIGGDEFIDITIDKDKAIEALTDYVNKQKGIPNMEVRHGEWEAEYSFIGNCLYYYCSICRALEPHLCATSKQHSNYCPNCGAKMDGGKVDAKV